MNVLRSFYLEDGPFYIDLPVFGKICLASPDDISPGSIYELTFPDIIAYSVVCPISHAVSQPAYGKGVYVTLLLLPSPSCPSGTHSELYIMEK